MGNTCKPMAVSFQCMTKPTTIKNNNNKKDVLDEFPLSILLFMIKRQGINAKWAMHGQKRL